MLAIVHKSNVWLSRRYGYLGSNYLNTLLIILTTCYLNIKNNYVGILYLLYVPNFIYYKVIQLLFILQWFNLSIILYFEPYSVVEGTMDSNNRTTVETTNCSICFNELENKCTPNSCKHLFCFKCLDKWVNVFLQQNASVSLVKP